MSTESIAMPLYQRIIVQMLTTYMLLTGSATARTWYVTVNGTGDVPTIQAAVDSARRGDEIVVGPGRYTWLNQGGGTEYAMITFFRGREGFTIRSKAGAAATILDAQRNNRVIYIQGYNNITIDGFTITGGEAPAAGYNIGGGICAHLSTNDIVRNCVIRNNHASHWAGGMWTGGWNNMRIENCTFEGNHADEYGGGLGVGSSEYLTTVTGCTFTLNTAGDGGGGIFINRGRLRLENSVIADNEASQGGGLYMNRWSCDIYGCTVAYNDATGGAGLYFAYTSDVALHSSIVAFNNTGSGITLEPETVAELGCCDVFGNDGGDFPGGGFVDAGGNFTSDPLFCGVFGSGDYSLRDDSPCLPGRHPSGDNCSTVGAIGAGCGSVPVRSTTWGRFKMLYSTGGD